MSQPVNTYLVEVILGEIQFETAPEIPYSFLKLIPAQSGD